MTRYRFPTAPDLGELLRIAGAGIVAAASPLPRPWEIPSGPTVGLYHDPRGSPAYRLVLRDDDQHRIEPEVTPELLARLHALGFDWLLERAERRPWSWVVVSTYLVEPGTVSLGPSPPSPGSAGA